MGGVVEGLAATSSVFASQVLVANVNTTPVGTGNDLTEDTLMQYTLPANVLNTNNMGVRITAWGTTLAAANNQTIKVYFGSAVIATLGPSAFGTGGWQATATVIRTSSGNQNAEAIILAGNVAITAQPTVGATAQTDTAAIIIKVTGQNGIATVNGVQQTGLIVELVTLPGGGSIPSLFLPASLSQSTTTQAITTVGSGTTVANVSGTYAKFVSAAGVGNGADLTNDPLWTLTAIPANTFTANGDALILTLTGLMGATGNNKAVGATVGGTQITGTVVTTNALNWGATLTITRVDATHVNLGLTGLSGVSPFNASSFNVAVSDLTTNTLAIVVTGASPTTGAAGDVKLLAGAAEFKK